MAKPKPDEYEKIFSFCVFVILLVLLWVAIFFSVHLVVTGVFYFRDNQPEYSNHRESKTIKNPF